MSRRFTTYENLIAFLTKQGSSYRRDHTLHPIGVGADDSNIISSWGRNKNGLIVPKGEVDLTKVSTTLKGVVASTSGGTVVLSSHTLPAKGKARFWNATDNAEITDADYTRATSTLTVGTAAATLVQAALTAGKTVHCWDIKGELQMGGSSRALQIVSGAPYFSSGVILPNAKANLRIGTLGHSKYSYSIMISASWAKSADVENQAAMVGLQRADGQINVVGFKRIASVDQYSGWYGADGALTPVALVGTNTDCDHFRMYPTVTFIMTDILPKGATAPSARVYQSALQMTEAPSILRFMSVPAAGESVTLTVTNVNP
jgi:hypothetical protein